MLHELKVELGDGFTVNEAAGAIWVRPNPEIYDGEGRSLAVPLVECGEIDARVLAEAARSAIADARG